MKACGLSLYLYNLRELDCKGGAPALAHGPRSSLQHHVICFMGLPTEICQQWSGGTKSLDP